MTKKEVIAAQSAGHIKALMGLARAYEEAGDTPAEFAALMKSLTNLHHDMRAFGLAHHREVTANFGDT